MVTAISVTGQGTPGHVFGTVLVLILDATHHPAMRLSPYLALAVDPSAIDSTVPYKDGIILFP